MSFHVGKENLSIEGGASFARSVHMLGSYWGLALMSLHIGLHWVRVLGMIRKVTVLPPSRRRKKLFIYKSQRKKKI